MTRLFNDPTTSWTSWWRASSPPRAAGCGPCRGGVVRVHAVARAHGGDRHRRRVRALPGLRRPRRPRPGPRRGHGQPVRLPVHPAGLLRRPRPPTRAAGCCSATATTPATCSTSTPPRTGCRPRASTAAPCWSPTTSGARRRTRSRSAAASPATSRSSRSPAPPPRRALAGRGGAAWPATPTTAPGRSASPSTAAPCPAQPSRCSPCRTGGWRSGWASTASPASTRPTCPPRTSSPSCSCPGCSRRCPRGRRAGDRVVPILNGLGTRQVRGAVRRLPAASTGCSTPPASSVVDPEVGEFSPASTWPGCSLTLLWLDDELERLWTAPADTPAFRTRHRSPRASVSSVDAEEAAAEDDPAGQRGVRAGGRRWSPPCSARCGRGRSSSTPTSSGRMDSVAGDGDHGIGMQRGSRAGAEAAAVGRRRRCGRRDDAGRGRRRLVRPGRRHLRGDLGADPADPRPGAGRRRAGERRRRWRPPRSRPGTS